MTSGDVVSLTSHDLDLNVKVNNCLRALGYLGLAPNPDQLKGSLTEEIGSLLYDSPFVESEPYIQLPNHVLSLPNLVTAFNKINPNNNTENDYLWYPGHSNISYSENELDVLFQGGSNIFPAHARLAVLNSTFPNDQLLHFTNMPFDQDTTSRKQVTQLDALGNLKQDHKDNRLEINALNAKAVVFIAIQRALANDKPPVQDGIIIDATLPRRHLYDRKSYIGSLLMVNKQIVLSRNPGYPRKNVGIGISMGPSLT